MLRTQALDLWIPLFLFSSEIFFRTAQELEYLFFCRAERNFVFHNLTLGYMTKTLNHIIFFPSSKIRIFFIEKNHNPPPFKLNGRSLKITIKNIYFFSIRKHRLPRSAPKTYPHRKSASYYQS
jgi:hypothetical protein